MLPLLCNILLVMLTAKSLFRKYTIKNIFPSMHVRIRSFNQHKNKKWSKWVGKMLVLCQTFGWLPCEAASDVDCVLKQRWSHLIQAKQHRQLVHTHTHTRTLTSLLSLSDTLCIQQWHSDRDGDTVSPSCRSTLVKGRASDAAVRLVTFGFYKFKTLCHGTVYRKLKTLALF